jgi:glycosyltransferase involved in cell wall biosynthesis
MKASVIIPTYNRSEILELTLSSLVGQDIGFDNYEVIVIDDGSSDNTREVVMSFTEKMNLIYYFQEDKGYRVALARNEGIKRAGGEIVIFLDTGMVVGRSFVTEHYNAHYEPHPETQQPMLQNRVIIGYVWGYDPEFEMDVIPAVLNFRDPDGTMRELGKNHQFIDIRTRVYGPLGDDLKTHPAPWILFWTTNASASKAALLEAGCFDESFITWGIEDIECGYRLYQQGAEYGLSRKAAGIHYPHHRETHHNTISNECNRRKFYQKFPTWEIELYMASGPLRFHHDYRNFLLMQKRLRNPRLFSEIFTSEMEQALAERLSGLRNIVFGCQDGYLLKICQSIAGLETDEDLAKTAKAQTPAVEIQPYLGVRTFYSKNQFEACLVAGAGWYLPEPFLTGMFKEAARIARRVYWLKSEDDLDLAGATCQELHDFGNGIVLNQVTVTARM